VKLTVRTTVTCSCKECKKYLTL